MNRLKTGDPCPCCGQPIKTRDPDVLALLTMIQRTRYFPSLKELHPLVRGPETGEDENAQ